MVILLGRKRKNSKEKKASAASANAGATSIKKSTNATSAVSAKASNASAASLKQQQTKPPVVPPRTARTKNLIADYMHGSTAEPVLTPSQKQSLKQTPASLVNELTQKLDSSKANNSSNEPPAAEMTPAKMKQSIDTLIGPSREWCSDSMEVKLFRKNIAEARRDWTKEVLSKARLGSNDQSADSDNGENNTEQQQQPEDEPNTNNDNPSTESDLSTYVSQQPFPDPRYFGLPDGWVVPQWQQEAISAAAGSSETQSAPTASNVAKSFICCVHIKELKMRKAVKCLFTQDTNHFIADLIQKFNERHNLGLNPDDFILRACGSYEFLYGDVPIGHFDYIHKTLKKSPKVELYLVTKRSVLGSHKPLWLDYDYQYTQREAQLMTAERSHTHLRCQTDLQPEGRAWYEMKYISMWDMRRPFRIHLVGVDTIPLTELFLQQKFNLEECSLYVVVKILHGGNSLVKKRFSRCVPYSNAPRFNQWLCFEDIHMCDIPKESKICFTLYCKPNSKNDAMLTFTDGEGTIGVRDYPVATIASTIIDYQGFMKTGIHSPKMWLDEKGGPLSSTAENVSADLTLPATTLSFEFEEYALPIVFPTGEPPLFLKKQMEDYETTQMYQFGKPIEPNLSEEIDAVLSKDALYKLTDRQKWLMWFARHKLQSNPRAISKFMLSVPWNQPYAVYEAHQLLKDWASSEPIDALELLDYNFADTKVRQYALSKLDLLSDTELSNYLLQLVQTLKFELGHDSSLARFLLQRSVRNPHLIGHIVYWHLVSEMHVPSIRERHGLILEEYLRHCGAHREQLLLQTQVLNDLNRIANLVKKCKTEKSAFLRSELEKVVPTWPDVFRLPLDPRMEVSGVLINKCKVMGSKKQPLWLVFGNSDPSASAVYVMYKAGDDLRQDLLTLQMLKVMDNLWKKENLDLHMKPYGCVCTGDETGMIEIVVNSDTIANITSARGGASAAFSKDPLKKWLQKYNPTPEQWSECAENFCYSCAGYCCATYVLGIGDRHNDNIMLQQNGDLFHIDFGHFLRHMKFFGPIARETAPFIFTPMYAQVLEGRGSELFNKFMDYGAKALNIIRANSNMFLNLFILMLSADIPELTSPKDMNWLRECMWLEKTEEEAAASFRELVYESLGNTRAKLNDVIHIAKHKGLL